MKLTDKVAIVTGAASGIGAAIALRFASEGADVVAADVNVDGAEQTAAKIREHGRHAVALQVDVSKSAEVDHMVATAIDRFGRLDIMVNNAGIGLTRAIERTSDDDWNRVVGINLGGVFFGIRAALPHMKRQGSGKIINTASTAGILPLVRMIAYSATKAGVIGMTKEAAIELAGTGICVNVIAPGFILSPSMADYYTNNAPMVAAIKSTTPHGYAAEPDVIAGAALYLASADGDYVNGQTIVVDGGYTAGKMS